MSDAIMQKCGHSQDKLGEKQNYDPGGNAGHANVGTYFESEKPLHPVIQLCNVAFN